MPEDYLKLVFEMCLVLTYQQVHCYSCPKKTVKASAVVQVCSKEGLNSGNKCTCVANFRLFCLHDVCKGAEERKVKQLLLIKIIPVEGSPETLSFTESQTVLG